MASKKFNWKGLSIVLICAVCLWLLVAKVNWSQDHRILHYETNYDGDETLTDSVKPVVKQDTQPAIEPSGGTSYILKDKGGISVFVFKSLSDFVIATTALYSGNANVLLDQLVVGAAFEIPNGTSVEVIEQRNLESKVKILDKGQFQSQIGWTYTSMVQPVLSSTTQTPPKTPSLGETLKIPPNHSEESNSEKGIEKVVRIKMAEVEMYRSPAFKAEIIRLAQKGEEFIAVTEVGKFYLVEDSKTNSFLYIPKTSVDEIKDV